MEILGRVHNGVVVPEGELALPEGTLVSVVHPVLPIPESYGSQQRVKLPLVPSDHPGSARLTAERVAELLDDEDVSP